MPLEALMSGYFTFLPLTVIYPWKIKSSYCTFHYIYVQLHSSLTVQSKSVGLGVDYTFASNNNKKRSYSSSPNFMLQADTILSNKLQSSLTVTVQSKSSVQLPWMVSQYPWDGHRPSQG